MNPGLAARICEPHEDPTISDCVRREDAGMTGGRWYPTLLTLPNSNILAMSGHPAVGDRFHSNFIPEVFVPAPSAGGTWHRLGNFSHRGDVQKFMQNDVSSGLYPRLHLLPTGDVFSSTPIGLNRTKSMTIH